MYKRLMCVLLFVFLLTLQKSASFADNRELIVYYAVGSSSAYRYHSRSTCPSLSRSAVGEFTLEEAVSRGYSPCSRCDPPTADFEISATPKPIPEKSAPAMSRSYFRSVQRKKPISTDLIFSLIGLGLIPAFFLYGLVLNLIDKMKKKK